MNSLLVTSSKVFPVYFLVIAALATASFVGVDASAAAADSKALAREHFERGVDAFNDRRFGDAAQEFDTAYQISPAYAVLYNIGQVNVALGNPVEAVEAFEKYLDQAGTSISAMRRKEVHDELDRQRARIGTLTLTVQPAGAEIHIDGKRVGTSPLRDPIRLAAGKHSILLVEEGYDTQEREVDLQPRTQVQIEMRLEPVRATEPAPLPARVEPLPSVANNSAPAPQPIITTVIREAPAAVPTSKPAPPPDLTTGSAQRGVGYIIGGIGIAVAAAGGVRAIISTGQASSAQTRESNANNINDGAAYDSARSDYNSARSLNRLGLEGLGAGAGLLLVGGVIVLTAPSPKASTALILAPLNIAHANGVSAIVTW